MQLSKFVQEFKQSTLQWIKKTLPDQEIYSFKPFLDLSSFEPHVLYIGDVSSLPIAATDETFNFLCIADPKNESKFSLKKDQLKNSNILVYSTELKFRDVCDLVSGLFLMETKLTSNINQMIFFLNENKGLTHLVDEAYKIIKSPIFVVDTSYKILAMHQENDILERPDLSVQKELGYMTEDNILRMKMNRIYEKARATRHPYYDKAKGDRFGWMNTLVYLQGIEVAQIGIMETDHPFTSYDFEFVESFSQIIAWELQKNDFYVNNRGLMHTIFLSELLDGKIQNAQIADLRKEQLGWVDTPYLYVLTIFDDQIKNSSKRAQTIANQLKPYISAYRYVVYDQKLVLLIQQMGPSSWHVERIRALEDYLSANHLIGAVSSCFTNLLDIRTYYQQTLEIYDLRSIINEKQVLYFYDKYIFYHMAHLLSKQGYLRPFYHPAILTMAAYDAKNHSNFIGTLHEYLLYVDNPTLCAKHLFIHKNTFFYRMNKIREIFDLNLNDGMERLRLHLTLELIQYDHNDS